MCAIAGAFDVPNASYVISLMLKAMQHRGQEAAGIVSTDGKVLHDHRGFGLCDEVFANVDFASRLPGTAAVGHLRYATTGDSNSPECIQPLMAALRYGPTAVVHNGNLTNYRARRAELEEAGAIFQSGSDTELFLHLMARSHAADTVARLSESFTRVEGAYSLLVLTRDKLIAAVDPLGFRPLAVARLGKGYLFASETCAFDLLNVRPSLPVSAGKIIEVSANGDRSTAFAVPQRTRHCSFEHIYFSRPDSNAYGLSSNVVRERLGSLLAERAPAAADLVTAVPDSSNTVALAYAEKLGLPFRFALIRNHYTGRTFITPKQTARELGVRMKLNAVKSVVHGKSVVVVDDSLVRGTTAAKVAALLRDAGATAVHLRIGSPPVIHPCFWGIDTPRRAELAAAQSSPAQLAALMGVDSLAYLNVDDLRKALGDEAGNAYCTTCFTGTLPDEEPDVLDSELIRDR
ncbi:MAG TPA: amidophosphoribosyltransferase [Candidatus Eisenbacteria bacterium]|jgi:amidophosphoribosyltransferase|nr:amidophosphoribosyltransferase [Candidatus Eisenbacteria bacterium]